MTGADRNLLIGAAAGATCVTLGLAPSAFVAPLGLGAASTGHAALGRGMPAADVPQGERFFAVAAAGSLALAASGLAALARRRSSVTSHVTARPGSDARPVPVFNWEVDPKIPEPGSEKMLQTMVGADVEMGEGPWDPMGFSKLYDRNFDFNNVMVYPHVQWLREAEIKHGRVCMLAFVGMVVQQFVQIPGYPAEPDWTKALALCYQDKFSTIGIVQISVFTMLVEGRWFPEGAWLGQMEREPGDLGFDPLKLTKKPGFDLEKAQLKELKNGRLAMIGVASMAANHAIPGSVPFLTGAYATAPAKPAAGNKAAFCGSTAAAPSAEAKTSARYTTQEILPAFAWIDSGVSEKDLQPTQLIARNVAGNDVLVGKDEKGTLFCVSNLCPHIGTPMSEGADVIGDVIVCPLHGSSFSTKTGDLIDWCPSPPIIGPLTGLVIEKKNLKIFDIRSSFFGGGKLEVQVDTNAKRAYEAAYWKGILDAQGKDDGTYY